MSDPSEQPARKPVDDGAEETATGPGAEETAASPEQLGRALAAEIGERTAEGLARVWRAFDEWDRARHADEGLRERKKRLTRQRISDAATTLFRLRGFDDVTVAEIAERVGVSEKTIYNYFPTKESLVFDQAEEQLLRLTAAVRDRPEGTSPTGAFVAELKREFRAFEPSEAQARSEFLLSFARMVHETPALRAAWGEHRFRMVEAMTEVLAEEFGVDPRDPEPRVAARGLVSLIELFYDATLRRLTDGVAPSAMGAAVDADLDRGARLLETGFWSFELLLEGRRTKQQLRDATVAAERARQQMLAAVRDAKQAWKQIRADARAAGREQAAAARAAGREQAAAARAAGREQATAARAAGREQAAAARAAARAAGREQAAAARAKARRERRER